MTQVENQLEHQIPKEKKEKLHWSQDDSIGELENNKL